MEHNSLTGNSGDGNALVEAVTADLSTMRTETSLVWWFAKLDRAKVANRIGSMPENMNFRIKASTVRQFLTSSGLLAKRSSRSTSMPTKELAKIAQKQTLMVMFHQ